jgi:pyruvate,water dikinase
MTAATQTVAPQPIETPAEFPVTWEQPGQEMLNWTRDKAHAPHPMAPLEYDLMFGSFMRGMTHAFEKYAVPVEEMGSRRINTYFYTAMVPLMLPPEEMEARGREVEARLFAAMSRVGELWRDELLPEVQSHLDALAAVDLALLSDADLRDALRQAIERGERLAQIHMEIVFPAYIAVSEFEEMYNELFSPEDKFEAHKLLQGLPNKTVEFGHELWRLSRTARLSPDVIDVLENESPARVFDALRETSGGQPFLADLLAYLEQYGQRSNIWGICGETWAENPTPVIKNLRDYVKQPDSASPLLDFDRLGQEREAHVAAARERLQGYPAPMREQFELMLHAAQEGIVITEDHGFYIDAAGLSQIRRAVLEAGRRLALTSTIESRDDVFMLFADELLDALADPAATDLADPLAKRRAEMAHFADVVAPMAVGSMPPGPPPESPMTRLMMKFGGQPAAPSEIPNEISGASGSAGKVVGIARVVRTLDDAARLQPGEILVAETTAPPWTPLFASAAAVVTDTGGVLSHCAVVAREYAIPAVVGTDIATVAIEDGQTIEVDGDAGVVRILGAA